MNEQAEQATETIIPTQESAGFVVPNVAPDGTALSMREQFDSLMQNPAFVDAALTPNTPAAAWVAKFNADAVGVPVAPPIGTGPLISASQPEEFTIPFPHGFPDSPEREAADMAFRGYLVAAGVDRETGNSLASLAAERIAHWEKASDWSQAPAEAERILRDVYRDEYETKVGAAQSFAVLIEAAQPGFGAFLEHTGLANDPTFIHRLATLAEARGC